MLLCAAHALVSLSSHAVAMAEQSAATVTASASLHSPYLTHAQGTTGKELMKLTDDILIQIGIKNPLHRMQLINTRDDLLAQQEQDTAVSPSVQLTPAQNRPLVETASPSNSKPASPVPSFAMPHHSPKVTAYQSACMASHLTCYKTAEAPESHTKASLRGGIAFLISDQCCTSNM